MVLRGQFLFLGLVVAVDEECCLQYIVATRAGMLDGRRAAG